MKSAIVICLVVSFCNGVFGQGKEPSSERSLSSWAEQLRHTDYAAREEASAKLREAGEAARPLLDGLKTSEDAEQRARALALLAELDGKKGVRPVDQEPLKPSRPAPTVERPRVQVLGGNTSTAELEQLLKRMTALGEMGGGLVELSPTGEVIIDDTSHLGKGIRRALSEGQGESTSTMTFQRAEGEATITQSKDGSITAEIDGKNYEAPSLEVFEKTHPDAMKKLKDLGFSGSFPSGIFGSLGSIGSLRGLRPALPIRPLVPVPAPIWEQGKRLGVLLEEVPEVLRSHVSLPAAAQLIKEVVPGSAAHAAGLRANDVLLEVAGQPAVSAAVVSEILNTTGEQADVELKVVSRGTTRTVTVSWPTGK